ncbi:MAG: LPS-assembly protein LptD [Pseudomonadales bacterium]|nr:LPS-assembly protein LptD [Pseudomonadales bacterium]
MSIYHFSRYALGCPAFSKRFLFISLVSCFSGLSFADTISETSKTHWVCESDGSGKGWQCQNLAPEPKTRDKAQLTLSPKKLVEQTSPLSAASPHTGKQASKKGILQDWYPGSHNQNSEDCCNGSYLAPIRTDADADKAPQDAEIKLSAEETLSENSVTTLNGNVVMTQGYRQLNSDRVVFDETGETIDVEGAVVFREPNLLVTGNQAEIDLASGQVAIRHAEFLLHDAHLRGQASSINREEGVIILDDVSATYCEPLDNTWSIRSKSMKLDAEAGTGEARDVKLYIKNVPVAYSPYLSFPIDDRRKSGFLTPSISSSDDGLDITLPYYFNLAPNYDATLISRLIQDRGFLLGGEFRHLSRYSDASLSASFLPNDDDTGTDRWLVNTRQKGGASSPWYTEVNYTRVSDDDYFRDLSNSGLKVNSATHLLEKAGAGLITDHWHFSGKLEAYQTIDKTSPDPYYQLPALLAEGSYDLPWNMQVDLINELVAFEHRDDKLNTTGERARLEYALQRRFDSAAFFITPAVKIRHIEQNLDLVPASPTTGSHASVTVPSFTLDSGLFFERESNLFSQNGIQTFEPRLFYYYADYENQNNLHLFDTDDMTFSYAQLFRDYRFSGGDRIGDANQLSLGLTTRYIDSTTGRQKMRFSIGQIYYFEDRNITSTVLPAAPTYNETRDQSSIASELEIAINHAWQINSELIWNDDINQIDKGSVGLHFNDGDNHLANASYRYINYSKTPRLGLNGLPLAPLELVERSIEQVDLSSFWGVDQQWSLIGKFNYDLTNSRELETIAGMQYNDCCWRVRLIYRKWVDNPFGIDDIKQQQEDSGVFLEFQLTGLGEIGEKIGDILDDSIQGFEETNGN